MNSTTRIIQTFWSGGRNPMECGYGWKHPETNLMSWALSCCSLRTHYRHVELYTDPRGYDVLIKKLRLPYTDVHVVYDDNLCLPQHWAYAKIKTYSIQTEPFLHVDGDIYVPNPLPQESLTAPLIAQNREIGTEYYRNIVDNILHHQEIVFPEYITGSLHREPVSSYNMGFFGGSDLEFIHQYCNEVFSFLKDNHMNDRAVPHSQVCCNILFEQIFFAIMAETSGKEVTNIVEHAVRDNGYSSREFANLAYWEQQRFFHLLGGHKHNPYNIEMIRQTLFRLYPDVLEGIITLFPEKHQRFSAKTEPCPRNTNMEHRIASYEDAVEHWREKWMSLDRTELYTWEKDSANSSILMRNDADIRQLFRVKCNPHIEFFHFGEDTDPEALHRLHDRLDIEEAYPLTDVVILPCLYDKGIREVPVVALQKKAIHILQTRAMEYRELEASLLGNRTQANEDKIKCWKNIVEHEITELIHKGVLVLLSEKEMN